ncbi:hypothetical protein C427_1836 [Paraglaciecola psychrophila 170]|jgi:hypothetical protein|uniref:Uncharacterized protein n=1 Tax=Paraglaciecola psychrophila 170 TaxID=1129794 RepID=K7APX3_9ALTE|nr:hypothetical protein [Paraglaciecola psychrophila]AGH43945.1 hypothetical protein C427_1836 [Paraglaciecola psychrophila 170]GAC37345.1 hypothetical protein GPSY_1716 [Paraglaciecola psychrophila 170]
MKINKAQIKRSQCANQKVELGKIDDAAAVMFFALAYIKFNNLYTKNSIKL